MVLTTSFPNPRDQDGLPSRGGWLSHLPARPSQWYTGAGSDLAE